MTAPSPAGQTPAERCRCDGGSYETRKHPFLVHPECPIHSGQTPADRGEADLIERVARAIAVAETEHVLHQGQWCICGWTVPEGDPAWVVRAHEHRCRSNAAAAVEVLRGETR